MFFALLDAIVAWIVAGRLLYEFFKTREMVCIVPCVAFGVFGYLFTKMFWIDLELMIEKRRETKDIAELQERKLAQEQQNEAVTAVKRKPRGR
ncbi:MAG: hypothetical protein HDQ95_13955 [Roseburia sp.]|nr:hypothetical protein [Roseburia sp.]